ncbi:MAG: UV damage endonuclease UvsE [Rhodospirillaceae bacterium]|nr:UV damage endonuclease UvsE [Rhodospirillales bacterium]
MPFDQIPRYGWCCQYLPPDGDAHAAHRLNPGTVTIATLSKLSGAARTAKLLDVLRRNLGALLGQLDIVAAAPPWRRLLRINSGLLPAYTHPIGQPLYGEPEVRALVEASLARAGAKAESAGIRIGLHPDQFCVLSSANPATLANSLDELEYHADILRMMGLAGGWHPHGAHFNIHGGGRAEGVDGFRRGFARLSEDARNLVTVENDEVSYGLDDLLPLADTVPLVLDVHHHWIKTQGQYIAPDDPRIAVVRDSWRGLRPIAHVSVSREDVLVDHDRDALPDFPALAAAGFKPRDLRAHSDRMWHRGINRFVGIHLEWADFEVEAKHKNLAVDDLERELRGA